MADNEQGRTAGRLEEENIRLKAEKTNNERTNSCGTSRPTSFQSDERIKEHKTEREETSKTGQEATHRGGRERKTEKTRTSALSLKICVWYTMKNDRRRYNSIDMKK
mmetsp:Transcript_37673/g.74071  ORF Transcript_37673/g.74071 Transcript_37673/m.74071 type:complete len:107 (+) Transcript_37673:1344-1664(+)